MLAIPATLRTKVLQACHNVLTSGYLGYTWTLVRAQQRCSWPRLTTAVKQHIRTCLDGQRRKSPPTKPAGLLQPVQVSSTSLDEIGMYSLGLLPTSAAGNLCVIVAMDYLIRHAETKAIQQSTAAKVAKFFIESVVLRSGSPSVIVRDHATAFKAALVEHVLMLSETSHRKNSAYHPQMNGLTERLNKTIEDILSMYVDVRPKNCDDSLPYITIVYNTTRQEVTRMTLVNLVHGHDVGRILHAYVTT